MYLAGLVASQYFPPNPKGLSKLQSKFHSGVAISFKEVSLFNPRSAYFAGPVASFNLEVDRSKRIRCVFLNFLGSANSEYT